MEQEERKQTESEHLSLWLFCWWESASLQRMWAISKCGHITVTLWDCLFVLYLCSIYRDASLLLLVTMEKQISNCSSCCSRSWEGERSYRSSGGQQVLCKSWVSLGVVHRRCWAATHQSFGLASGCAEKPQKNQAGAAINLTKMFVCNSSEPRVPRRCMVLVMNYAVLR